MTNGIVKSIASADGSKRTSTFEELSGTTKDFVKVVSFENNVVKLDDGTMFSVKENASVYVLDKGKDSAYRSGSLSNIYEGVKVRAYDVLDDKETSADVIVVTK